MDISILEPLAKIAGIGGLSIGTLVIIFRAILKLNVFHQLNQTQTYKILNQIIRMTFSIAILGLLVWAYISITDSRDNTNNSEDSVKVNKQSVNINNSHGTIGNVITGDNNKINNELKDTIK